MPSFYVLSDFDPLTFGQVRPDLTRGQVRLFRAIRCQGLRPEGGGLVSAPDRPVPGDQYGGVQPLQPLDRREETRDAALD